jgi:hypothetical protein
MIGTHYCPPQQLTNQLHAAADWMAGPEYSPVNHLAIHMLPSLLCHHATITQQVCPHKPLLSRCCCH